MPDLAAGIELVARESSVHGVGVFTAKPIVEGAHIGSYTGIPTTVDGTHVLWIEGDDGEFAGIDGEGILRWLNHSSAPNVEFDGPELYALRDIDAEEELLFHYGEEWDEVP